MNFNSNMATFLRTSHLSAFSRRMSRQLALPLWGSVTEALKGKTVKEIVEIFGGDCERIDNSPADDTLLVGVRFDEEKMIKFCLEKLYPAGAPGGLYETLLRKLADYEDDDADADGYLFFLEEQGCDDDGDSSHAEFRVPYVSDDVFCENFFLCYLELRLEEHATAKKHFKLIN